MSLPEPKSWQRRCLYSNFDRTWPCTYMCRAETNKAMRAQRITSKERSCSSSRMRWEGRVPVWRFGDSRKRQSRLENVLEVVEKVLDSFWQDLATTRPNWVRWRSERNNMTRKDGLKKKIACECEDHVDTQRQVDTLMQANYEHTRQLEELTRCADARITSAPREMQQLSEYGIQAGEHSEGRVWNPTKPPHLHLHMI